MAGDDQEQYVITIEKLPSLDERFDELERAGDYDITPNKAGKVPPFMRTHPNLCKYFEPRFVSFGPIHHGKPEFQSAEEYKLRLANYFVNDSGKSSDILYKEVEGKYESLVSYFDEVVVGNYEKEELAWMLFVDGCAVLQSIFCAVQVTFEELKIEQDKMALWEQDLFLLENQLPYQLLLDLMDSSQKKDQLRESIEVFINKHSVALHSYNQKEPKWAAHILDYLWQLLVDEEMNHQPLYSRNKSGYRAAGYRQSVPWHHNAQELKTAGINVKPSKGTLTDIDFAYNLLNFSGYLSIPPVVVDYTTGFKLVNLIAHEMTLPGMSNYDGVTSYVSFLGSILDGTGDVKQLIKARVLFNYLDKDDEVFQLFKDISTNLMPVPNEFHVNLKRRIEKYYGNKYKIWMAQLFHDLFSRPWKILTFSASVSALLLTATQTLYPIFSTSGHGEDQVRKKFN
ncbi:hypothetical protein I3843_09G045500 [Carya illinoinensis]|uniref:Uncharacterized protein n=1 Tax=Carya illinoinensis TaxID=32201 RepID=A0A8T1PIX3_CARIL|nr:uncharacterized protein LOC122277300 [Carya illinoinensis]KAG6641032.1 hypothetical protein CIPAW_09G045100 [Carya illinoinensis]KAG6694373.1 hypothetical protein I3842_09G045100 [Carya illinoinensis]KAG7962030.1 hypothetical protein I3843_09G045500 [Carya illinoinensis]